MNSAPRPSAVPGQYTPHPLAAPLLSGVAGFVDTAGFVALYGLFTAHVTGNLVTAGAALARLHAAGAGEKLSMIPLFMLAVAAAVWFIRVRHARGHAALVPLLAMQAVALVAFLVAGALLTPRLRANDGGWPLLVTGGVGVVAMAIQNALMRESLGGPPTTVMTGNVTQLVVEIVDWIRLRTTKKGDASIRAQVAARLAKTATMLGVFVVGAALGAFTMSTIGFFGIGAPVVALVVLIAVERRRT